MSKSPTHNRSDKYDFPYPCLHCIYRHCQRHAVDKYVILYKCIDNSVIFLCHQGDDLSGAGGMPSIIVNRVFNGLSPLYCLTVGVLKIENYLGMRSEVGLPSDASVFDLQLCGENLIFLAGHAVVWLTLLFLLDMWQELKGGLCFCCMGAGEEDDRAYVPINEDHEDSLTTDKGLARSDTDLESSLDIVKEDVDVYNERMRILAPKGSNDALQVINLRQVFKVSVYFFQIASIEILITFFYISRRHGRKMVSKLL